MKKENPPKKETSKPSLAAVQSLKGIGTLVLLEDVFLDETGFEFVRLLKWLAKDEADAPKGNRRYGKLWRALMEQQVFSGIPPVGNALQDYFLERFLESGSPFHRKAEFAPLPQINPSLSRTFLQELEILQRLLKTDWEAEFLKKSGLLAAGTAPSLENIPGGSKDKGIPAWMRARKDIKSTLLSGTRGNPLLAAVADHFFTNGWGLFGKYRAFRWEVTPNGPGHLSGIESIDPIRLKNLVGYDEARKALLENIEGFVAGKGANNVLIYGERGTGKSSTVKALLNDFQDRGLRLVEVTPSDLVEYHFILRLLRNRREKFVLFVDDLSFEENETSYKGLKALLEGGVESTPENVILIATSNRRHLVREFFTEREEGVRKDGEVHGQDTVEEKLSLSDRFGLVVSFYTPNQETYLKMVESWAKAEGIKMAAGELHSRALLWARQNNGPSGRTARQFINDLKGRL